MPFTGTGDTEKTARTRQRILENSFKLFAKRGIEAVTIPQVAKAAGVDRSLVYMYFPSKLDLAIAISAHVWGKFNLPHYEREGLETQTAAERYEFWLDSFLELWREHRDILRFNQFFNVFVTNEKMPAERMEPYTKVIGELEKRFHAVYELAKQDGTLRTDIPEQKIFSTTLHLMLAAATRYAVGLIYQGGEAEEELTALKEMLMQRYTNTQEVQERT